MTSTSDQPLSQTPKDFFDDSSFKTLYGGVVVTWISTSAIADVLGGDVDLKMLGFIISIIVAFVGYALSDKRTLKKFIITPFNGLLIYLTIMGGTSFLSADIQNQDTVAGTGQEQIDEELPSQQVDEPSRQSAFFRAWNPNKDLIQRTNTLIEENTQLEVKTERLQQVNQTYETKLDSTRQVIQTLQIPPETRNNLLRNLEINNTARNLEIMNNPLNQ